MAFSLSVDDLLAYIERDRSQWHAWFRASGPAALAVDLGANNSGRIQSVGELIRHIFSAELRYVERSRQLPLTDTGVIPADDIEALFAFGARSHDALRELLATFRDWGAPREMTFGTQSRTVTPRKMVLQAITHEIRHWAQIATFLRQAGYQPGVHDLIA